MLGNEALLAARSVGGFDQMTEPERRRGASRARISGERPAAGQIGVIASAGDPRGPSSTSGTDQVENIWLISGAVVKSPETPADEVA